MFFLLKKIISLPLDSKIMALKLFFLQSTYWLISAVLPSQYFLKSIGRQGEEYSGEWSEKQKRFVAFLFRLFRGFSKYRFFKYRCLVRVLAAAKILRQYKIPYTIYFGLTKEDKIMKAHTWIKSSTFHITGDKQGNYHIITSYAYLGK